MLSAIVLTKNNQHTLGACLKSLGFADEIIIIDDFSTDKTEIVAKKLNTRYYRRHLNSNWAAQRNFGLNKAKHNWVFFLDSDEHVSDGLAKEILETINASIHDGYFIKRQDIFCGRVLKHGETGNLHLLRLAKKSAGKWKRTVHETWKIKGKVGILTNPILHQRDLAINEFIDRINSYTEIDAAALQKESKEFSSWQLMKPIGKFFNNFLVNQGFRDGFAGLVFAWLMSFYSLVVRVKAWQISKKKGWSNFEKALIGILGLFTLVNFIPVLGPELGFDALWYHLTLPKLWLLQNRWFYPGGLLYYSAMPRLAETIFIPALSLVGTTGPKFIQYLCGLGSAWLTFKIARRFYSREISIAAMALFYGTWLVSWQSGSAYVDLIRTFLETLGLYFLIKKKVFPAGIAFGLAIGVKWQALLSVAIAAIIFDWRLMPIAILFSTPWFLIAQYFTSNPIFPIFEPWLMKVQMLEVGQNYYLPLLVIKRIILIPYYLIKPFDDPLNPLLGILVLPGFTRVKPALRRLGVYLMAGLIIWQLLSPPSSRYLLPHLPLLAIYSAALIERIPQLKPFIIASLLLILLARITANYKYLPVITRRVTQDQFLTKHANRLPDTFIDADGWVAKNISPDSKVLVDGLHNLYYIPVNFDHISWVDDWKGYEYLITTNQAPDDSWKLLHQNLLNIRIYKK